MIVSHSDFYGKYYLPQAKPGLVPENSVSDIVTEYINEYSADCLLKCFGYIMFEDFASQLDSTQSNGLKAGTDSKWNDLLNGKSYVKDDKNVKWRGLRYKEIGSDKYKSLLVAYIFYHFQLQTQTQTSMTGEKKISSKNSQPADVSSVLCRSWNQFVDQAQKEIQEPILIERPFGYGLDYFSSNKNQYITLNEFIVDMNKDDNSTYPDYSTEKFRKLNLGL